MAKNKISDLRDHLFATLEALQDAENPMEIERARAVSEVAQTIINSAKVEVDLLKVVSGDRPGTNFFDLPEESRELPERFRSVKPGDTGSTSMLASPNLEIVPARKAG